MTDLNEWVSSKRNLFQGQILWDEPLSRHTYYRIGGPAKLMLVPSGYEDLKWIHDLLKETNAQHFILGLGSNLLVSDLGYSGVVIKTTRVDISIREEQSDGALSIVTGASVANSSLLRRAAQEGWSGFEFLVGIPGSIGGAVWMNAGTFLGETAAHLKSAKTFRLKEGTIHTHKDSQLRYEYRKNLFLTEDEVVLSATWNVQKENPDLVKLKIDDLLKRRKATQPIEYPSCGSVFKNPPQISAWQVVDQLGLRGFKIGAAQISEKHSNFIVNLGGAKASDVFNLIQKIKDEAKKRMSVDLHEEVRYLGYF